DRTGVFAAVLLSFLGVSDSLIALDYALTESLLACGAEAMTATLAQLRERYGSAAGYLSTVAGLSDEELARLRRTLVVDLHGYKLTDPVLKSLL
ncbi:hypothetical protein HK405_000533, partial [Cladochytrium tenue]